MRLSITLALCIALVGCSDTDTKNSTNNNATSPDMAQDGSTRSCGEIIDDVYEMALGVPQACTSDTDCRTTLFGSCSCPQPHATDDDLDTRISVLLNEYDAQACSNATGCNSAPTCLFGGQSDAACVESACILIPRISCDAIESNPGGGAFGTMDSPAFCSSAADCELRTDTNLCGCPEAVYTQEGAMWAAALERSDCSADVCAALDCAAGTAVDCVDDRCVLVD